MPMSRMAAARWLARLNRLSVSRRPYAPPVMRWPSVRIPTSSPCEGSGLPAPARRPPGPPPQRLLDLDEPPLGHQPERQAAVGGEAHRFDEMRREPAGGAHPVLPVLVLGEEDRAPARARQLGDGVEEEIEHARQGEARGGRER